MRQDTLRQRLIAVGEAVLHDGVHVGEAIGWRCGRALAFQVHSNNTWPPASVRISVMRANFPYCLQCRSASSCTALALVANHLSTWPLALLFAAGGASAHAESTSAIAMMMTGLKVMTHLPVVFVGKTLSSVKSRRSSARFCQLFASFELWTARG